MHRATEVEESLALEDYKCLPIEVWNRGQDVRSGVYPGVGSPFLLLPAKHTVHFGGTPNRRSY